MDENLTKKIIEIVASHTGMSKDEISPSANLVNDLNIQRIEIPNILMAIEQELKVTIPQDQIGEIETIEDIAGLVTDSLV